MVSHFYICDMKRQHLTPAQAWADFEKTILPGIKAPDANLRKAIQTGKGKVVRAGKAVALGPRRIKRLLDQYAPGVYEFHDGEPYFTKKQ